MTTSDRCVIVASSAGSYEGKQGHTFLAGISRTTAGSTQLCLHVMELPPATAAKPHLHAGHESAAFIVSGEVDVHHGPGLIHLDRAGPGDFVFIPAGVPHVPVNRSPDTPAIIVLARTDPNEQESVELLDIEIPEPARI
ncbi:cupin domain-containing protein [Actinoplanes utahensis]|uniref:Cupin type-2 domain-containing protein n=2 Tax=Actinoplanes utahensis TaxID=1869 RepID=A0A0A6UH31_ACTUT|nr:cupin domain-containing protein [Actinoplanes utahensis]KHD75325.1 hypothetical protein MB27_23970 [Actinoplanes utahensis]